MSTVILGGGIAGLLAAYVLRDQKPVVLEASARLGGNFTAGGLKYIHGTPEMEQLLDELKVPFQHYMPRGVLHTGSAVHDHPDWLRRQPVELRKGIQFDHWMKTRGGYEGFREDCMNDPLGEHVPALWCDHEQILTRLELVCREAGVEFRLGSLAQSISEQGEIKIKDGTFIATLMFKRLITTLPLGMMARLAPWADLPKQAKASQLGILRVRDVTRQQADWTPWDYMYTPRAPLISRIVSTSDGFQLEVPIWGELPEHYNVEKLVDVANSMIATSVLCAMSDRMTMMPGHLLPLSSHPVWPKDWHPLGRFAEWNSRATADKVLARALQLHRA